MHYATIKNCDIANGPGVRVSLFVSGCTHRCPGCFNEVAWDFDYGEPFTQETIDKIIAMLKPDYVRGLTLLGGEPFEHENQKALVELLKRVRQELTNKNVWCYTGYTFEEVLSGCNEWRKLLENIDVLVDGPFLMDQRTLNAKFHGSANQRIIDVPASLLNGKVILTEYN